MSTAIDKALQHRVVMIEGSEFYLVRRAIRKIIDGAGLSKDDYDLESISGEGTRPHEWLANVGTLPFLSPRRCLIVRNALKADIEGIKASDLAGLPESSLLILVQDEEQTEEKNSKATTRKKALTKLVTASKGYILSFTPDPKEAVSLIKEELERQGRKASSDTVNLLLEMTGGSVSRALEEIEKVLLFTSKEHLTDNDIRTVVVPSREWNVWKMIDAMATGNVSEALNQLKVVLANTKKPEDVAFGQLFPLLSRQFRLLTQARICVEAGVQPSSAPADILALFPRKPNISTESPFRQNAIMRAAKTVTLAQMRDALGQLALADAKIKGMGTSFSTNDTLEQLVFELAAIFRPKAA